MARWLISSDRRNPISLERDIEEQWRKERRNLVAHEGWLLSLAMIVSSEQKGTCAYRIVTLLISVGTFESTTIPRVSLLAESYAITIHCLSTHCERLTMWNIQHEPNVTASPMLHQPTRSSDQTLSGCWCSTNFKYRLIRRGQRRYKMNGRYIRHSNLCIRYRSPLPNSNWYI